MPTIPFSQVANIVPGVLSAAGSAVDLNAVVLTQSQYAPQQQVLGFDTAQAAADWFGATSLEAQIAAGYFQGPDNATATPGLLKFLAYAESAVEAFLLGSSQALLTLSELQTLSGTLTLTVGTTPFTSGTISFTPLVAPVQLASTTSTTGGSLAAATYYTKVTAITASGETTASNEESVTTTGTASTVTVTWDSVPGATGYKIYVGTSANSEGVYASVGAVTTYDMTALPTNSAAPPSVNTTGANSFSEAASMIQSAFTSPTFSVTFDSLHQAFMITTTATGVAATLTYCTGTLASGIGLDAGSGGTLSQGAAATTPATAMAWLVSQDQNWASFLTAWSSQLTEREAFAEWTSQNAPRYAYIEWDTDTADDTANNSASFGGYLTANTLSGTLPVYGSALHAAMVAGWAASLNFTQKNGRSTLCFRSQAGLAPSVTDSTTYANVTSNGYNVYAAFGSNNPANNANWMTPGTISGKFTWADTYFNQIWLNAQLQAAVVALMQSVGSIPYNSAGDALIDGALRAPILAAVNFGAIRAGVSLSASQVQQVINQVGVDVSATLTAQGWYLYSNAAGTPASVRATRGSPPCTLLYMDGESVQSLTLPSIVIQ